MSRAELATGWWMRSSAGPAQGGAELSRPGAGTDGWLPLSVPMTVLAGLVENGVVPDPFPGDAFLSLPGRPREPTNFANLPMPEDSPFRVFETLRVGMHAVDAGLLRRVQTQRPKAALRSFE